MLLYSPKLCGSLWTNHFQPDTSWHCWLGEEEMSAFVADLFRSPSHPSSTPGTVQSLRPISHALNTVTFHHKLVLSLSPLPPLYSVSLLPPFWTPSHSLLHSEHPTLTPSLPLLLALSISYMHFPLVVHYFLSVFHPLFRSSISLSISLVFSLRLPLFPGITPSGSDIHFKSLHCLGMPTYSTSSLPTLLSLT